MRLAAVLLALACFIAAAVASGQSPAPGTPPAVVPLGRRTFIAEGVRYEVAGTSLHLRVGNILQAHVAGDGWLSSATLEIDDGTTHTSMPVGLNSAQPSTTQRWNGYQFTVYAIHHTGGIELTVTRVPGH